MYVPVLRKIPALSHGSTGIDAGSTREQAGENPRTR